MSELEELISAINNNEAEEAENEHKEPTEESADLSVPEEQPETADAEAEMPAETAEEPETKEPEIPTEPAEETEPQLQESDVQEPSALEITADEAKEEESGLETFEETIAKGEDVSKEPEEPAQEEPAEKNEDAPHHEAANAPSAEKAKAVLEGMLFIVGDDGITAEQAAQALDITPELCEQYFDELMQVYTDDSHGIEIANYGGTYRFLSKAEVHEYAKRLFQMSKHATLSQAALETLAIIAYKQPITRVEIEEIRGVGADMMLRKLLARDLIKESGRSEAAGRPILYEVTDEFMNSFKLLSLKELPELPQFDEQNDSEDLFEQ